MNDPDLAYKQRKIDEVLERRARYGPDNQGQIRGLLQEAIENVEDGFDPTVIITPRPEPRAGRDLIRAWTCQ